MDTWIDFKILQKKTLRKLDVSTSVELNKKKKKKKPFDN